MASIKLASLFLGAFTRVLTGLAIKNSSGYCWSTLEGRLLVAVEPTFAILLP